MKTINFITLITLALLFLSGCSENESGKDIKIALSNPDPPVVFSDRQLTLPPQQGATEPTIVEIPGPWTLLSFDIVNNGENAVTISAVSYTVTGPDGEPREGLITDITRPDLFNFGTIRAERDLDCDGVVEENEVLSNFCSLDDTNPSFNSTLFFVSDLLEGLEQEEINSLRGGSFIFEVRFEGWIGTPENPIASFFKIINFDIESNL